MTTLDDLKRAIEAVPDDPWKGPHEPAGFGLGFVFEKQRAEAWRAAFEWRDGIEFANVNPGDYDEGMRLIREHLK